MRKRQRGSVWFCLWGLGLAAAGIPPELPAQEIARIDVAEAVEQARLRDVESFIVVFRDDAKTDVKTAVRATTDAGFANIASFDKIIPEGSPLEKSLNDKATRGRRPGRAERNLMNMHRAYPRKGADKLAALKELQASPLVKYAEPNYRVQACGIPNDPLYPSMFPMHNTGQQTYLIESGAAMGSTNGLPDADMDWQEAWTNSTPGQEFPTGEVVVAVIDTGVDYTHGDITNNMWKNPGEIPGTKIDDDGNGYVDDVFGVDFYYDDSDPMDLESEGGAHGSHVAGTIAAEADNGYGVAGVNPHARIMALKFLGPGGGYTDDAIEAIIYGVDNGAHILNNSWGGGSWQQSLQDAIDYAVTNGVVFVAASGNSDSGSPFYPASYRGSISVNSMNWNDEKAFYSNYGWFTDVSAHGSEIVSLKCADYTDDDLVVSNDFVVFHGTSMACPQAAGALSLLVAKYPGLHPYIYERVLEETCDTEMLGYAANQPYEGELGAGRINVNRLLNEDVEAGFLRLLWAGDTDLAVPGEDYHIAISAGTWTNDYTDVSIVATNTTDGISLNNWSHNLGSMTGLSQTNLSTNTFVATIATDTTNSREELVFELRADGRVLAEQTLRLSFINGNAQHLVVDDFNNDGIREIATAYRDYTMVYNADTQLVWIAESTLGGGNWTFNIASADLTGDGFREIVATEHRWLFSSGPPGLFVYDYEGDLLEGFPVISTNAAVDDRRGFGEPVLADVDEDGAADIVCNMEYTNGTSFVRVYDAGASVLWERVLPLPETGPPSAADLDGDGYEELVVWNYDYGDNGMPRSRLYVLEGDGTILSTIEMPFIFTSGLKELHTYDKAAPALGDIDGDGDLEILLYGYDSEKRIAAYHHDGSPVAGWPVSLPGGVETGYQAIQLADADGDGDTEVFTAASIFDGGRFAQLFAFEGDGTSLSNFPSDVRDEWEPAFRIDDVTGDGLPNILVAGDSDAPGTNVIYVLDMDGTPIPGYDPYEIPLDGLMGIEDMVLTTLTGTTRYVVMSIASELVMLNTGYGLNELPGAWPARHRDARRTAACTGQTGPVYKSSFQADARYAISNLTAVFTAHPVGFDAAAAWYTWDFENDGIADVHSYGVPMASNAYTTGVYDVSLTVSNAAGASFTRIRSNYVHVLAPIQADFEAVITTASAPVTVRFTDLSHPAPQSWAWDLDGDGTIDSTDRHPEFYYTDSGSYTVTLTVANNFHPWGGSTDTVTRANTVVLTNETSPTVHYVSTNGLHLYPFKTWREAATNIQDAIDAGYNDHTVIIGDGEFIVGGGGSRQFFIDHVGKNRDRLTVRSANGPLHTTLAGWGSKPYHRGFWIDDANDVTIDGFTFRDIYNNGGGGVLAGLHTRTPVIQNCIFTNLVEPTPVNGGACINIWNDGAIIRDCRFFNNRSRRGAIQIRTHGSYTALVENCEFRNNSGDSYVSAAAILFDNRSASFAFPGDVGTHIVRNCLFAENTGWYSIVYSQPSLTLENCTFTDNRLLVQGAGILRSKHESWAELEGTNQGPWTVRNTIVYDNDTFGPDYQDQPASPISFSHSCLTTTVAGAGNITADPGLSGLPGDYHLSSCSPCIDAGTNLAWMSAPQARDLPDGDARILGGRADIGVDEFKLGGCITASPRAGTSTLHVALSASAHSYAGTITNFAWTFGDGSGPQAGASLTNLNHSYTGEGQYTVVLTLYDDAGHTASNGLVITVDDTGPEVDRVRARDATTVEVRYDEAVLPASATNLAHYSLDTAVISNAVMSGPDAVWLTVGELADLATNTLTLSGILDVYGNVMSGPSTQSFVYVDPYADNRLMFDFGYDATTNAGWNNVGGYLNGYALTNVVNIRGGAVEASLTLLDNFDQLYTSAGSSDTNTLYPATAQRDVINHNESFGKQMELAGLNPSNTYDLIFFASISHNDDYASFYGVGPRLTEVLQTYGNTSNTVMLSEVAPEPDGSIRIDVYKEGVAANLGVLEVRPHTPNIEISTNRVHVPEGNTAVFSVRLREDPGGVVTVKVERASGDADISVNIGSRLVFTPDDWDAWQAVQLLAEEDGDSAFGTATIRCFNTLYISRTVTAVEVENDVAISVSDHHVYVPENSGAQFDIRLTAPPTHPVTATVARASGDADIQVLLGTNLVFTSNTWDAGQSVVLAAGSDPDADNSAATIRCEAPSLGSTADVTAVEIDASFEGFTAYHDMDDDALRNPADHAHATHGSTHGTAYALRDIDSGSTTGVEVVYAYYDDNGESPAATDQHLPDTGNAAAYRDAFRMFNGFIDAASTFRIRNSDHHEYATITFTNLLPGARYDVALYMNRDRFDAAASVFTLQGAETFAPAASDGVDDLGDADDATFRHDCNNTESGYVVGWNNIHPVDGQNAFSVNVSVYFEDTFSYLPQAVRLVQRDGTADHEQRVVVSTNRVVIPEPSYQSFEARLAVQPSGVTTVTVRKVAGDPDILISEGQDLVFSATNWNLPRTVTLWGGSDADDTDGEATLHAVAAGVTTAVTAVEADDEDATGPVPRFAVAPDTQSVSVYFNEAVDSATSGQPTHYSLDHGISVNGAARNAGDPTRVDLTVSTMTAGTYRLTLNGIRDLHGNTISANAGVTFTYSGSVGFYTNTFDADPGWVETGLWDFGAPTGQGGSNDAPYGWGHPDPVSGYSGSTVYGYNLDGNYQHADPTVDGEEYSSPFYLTTTALDCSDYVDISLAFRRWLNVKGLSTWTYAQATVEASSNGMDWTTVWSSDQSNIADAAWTHVSFDISAVADRAETVYLRWGLYYESGWYQASGWNLDDLVLSGTYVGEPAGGIELSATSLAVAEGSNATFSIRLYSAPSQAATVTVARTGGDADIGVQGASSFVFDTNNWDSWQPVTLTAAQDPDFADGVATVTCTSAGMDAVFVAVTEVDDELNPALSLPFSETFEGTPTHMAGARGDVTGQHGWTGEQALVTDADAYNGTQSLHIAEGHAAHAFVDGHTNVTLTFRARPTFGDTNSAADTDATVIFWFNTNGHCVGHNGPSAQTSAVAFPEGKWLTMDLSIDYGAGTWSLEVDSTNVFSDFGFFSGASSFSRFKVRQEATHAVALDDLHFAGAAGGPDSDSDSDGIPDWWETHHQGTLTNMHAATDLDGDGLLDLQEYIASTDPTNAASRFRVRGFQQRAQSQDHFVLTWDSVSGRVYTVYWGTNLAQTSDFEHRAADVPAVPPRNTWTDSTHSAEQSGYYRIDVRLSD